MVAGPGRPTSPHPDMAGAIEGGPHLAGWRRTVFCFLLVLSVRTGRYGFNPPRRVKECYRLFGRLRKRCLDWSRFGLTDRSRE